MISANWNGYRPVGTTEPTFEARMAAVNRAGREARRLRRPLSACPHHKGTPAFVEWCDGWNVPEKVKS